MLREYSDQIAGGAAFFKMSPSLALPLLFHCCHLPLDTEGTSKWKRCQFREHPHISF